ncbi:PD-(D/E)XK nuclease family protein [Geminocystis sp. CENA526]|uniref:PD-(D/E)XK nuclease family protein n=1 Tax=Geminocystis sp. CENA526 TaxID=1355871 RepID=UPI003D702220
MTIPDIKTIIRQELPQIIAQDASIRDFILRTVSEYYSPKQETESKFDRILAELQLDREEQARKWDENNRKWDENNRRLDNFIHEQNLKWEENTQRLDRMQNQIDETLQEIKKLNRQYDSSIGALGSRWGLYSEGSFRNALKGILEESFGVEVLNINTFDQEGDVFGRPDQVEIDVIIRNGTVIVCEIKSSISKAEMYVFDRKVTFYEKHYQRQVNRKIVISPMVDKWALPVARNLGIEVYSYAEDVIVE